MSTEDPIEFVLDPDGNIEILDEILDVDGESPPDAEQPPSLELDEFSLDDGSGGDSSVTAEGPYTYVNFTVVEEDGISAVYGSAIASTNPDDIPADEPVDDDFADLVFPVPVDSGEEPIDLGDYDVFLVDPNQVIEPFDLVLV